MRAQSAFEQYHSDILSRGRQPRERMAADRSQEPNARRGSGPFKAGFAPAAPCAPAYSMRTFLARPRSSRNQEKDCQLFGLTVSDVSDYRVIYRFDPGRGEIYLVAIGHRREIYRD